MPEDVTLVEAAASGDSDAFAALASSRVDRLYATAVLMLRDHSGAEDAVQEALVRAWRDLPTLRDRERFDAWLRRLLVRACYDEARRKRRHRGNVTLLPGYEPTRPDESAALADREEIHAALARLSTDHRAIVVHHYYLGLSLAELAHALDIPLGTVKSRLHHARIALRDGLARSATRTRSEGHVA
jgi:RNA polymerase sigma-70 factor (ECF subfamily)